MTAPHLRFGLGFMVCVVLAGSLAFAQAGPGGASSLDDYVFATPPRWTGLKDATAIALQAPGTVTGERCVLQLWPMRLAGANLFTDANNAFMEVFRMYEVRNMTSTQASVIHGVSGQGWEYVMIRRGLGPRGVPGAMLGFVFVAKLNNRLAVISGLTNKEPLVSMCFGEMAGDVWPKFFYSLSFKGWTAPDQSAAMRNKLAGVWMMATATAGDQMAFGANGRYGGVAAAQQYTRLNSSEVLRTTQAFAGNGAYSLRGNSITLTPDGRPPEAGWFRVEEETKDEGRTWHSILYLLRISSVDGKEYEARYQKQ